MTLTPLQRTPYVREVHDLVGALLQKLTELEVVSTAWQQADKAADQQIADPHGDTRAFAVTLQSLSTGQTTVFMLLEGFLAAWARLSLLFFPTQGDRANTQQRRARAETLRQVLGVGSTHPLADRDLRNAWMHFDERLDAALVHGTYADRHRFVRSDQAAPFLKKTLRLLEVDTLVVHYTKQDGTPASFDVKSTRGELERLWQISANPLAD